MFCNKCGNQLADNAKFCTKCGHSINSNQAEVLEQNATLADVQPGQDAFAPQTTPADQTAVMPQNENPAQTAFQQPANASQPQDAFQQPVDQTAVMPQVSQAAGQAPATQAQAGYQQQYAQGQPQKNNSNVALFVILGILIAVIIAAVLVIFLVIKPFDQPETTTTATHVTEETDTNKNNNNNNNNNNTNNNSSTKTVSCVAANGSTLTGTVRIKDGYVIPDSSSKSYSASEIAALGLNDAELCIAWNEPYARAGYHFKNSGLQQYFNSCSWYHDTGFSGTLSDTGGQNANVIKGVAGSTQWKNLATY